MFVRNSWYAAAESGELAAGRLFARTILGEPMVLFRTRAGISAFEDRCPHRRMPLSLGRLTAEERLVCAYHGLAFDGTGACVEVPGQPTTSGIRVRSFPAVERCGFVWVWMGDAQRADPAQIFDCSWLERPGWQRTSLYRHTKGNYLLINDNLADLLHVAFLHITSGAGNEQMGPAETKLDVAANGYRFRRETKDIPAPAGYGRLANTTKNIDRWHLVDFHGPSFYRIYTGVAETGSGGPDSTLPDGAGRWAIVPHHLITPETEKSTHYWQVIGHQWQPTPESSRFANQVMDEDIWAIEAQQRNIDLRPNAPMHSIASDAAMVAMRRIVQSMLQAEAAGGATG